MIDILSKLKPTHVRKAAKDTDEKGINWLYVATGRSKARTKFVLVNGSAYPAKALGCRAVQIATNSNLKLPNIHTDEVVDSLKELKFEICSKKEAELEISSTRIKKYIEALCRPEQAKFRKLVLRLYGRKCAITGCTSINALEAAHIEPVAQDGSDKPSNGILLRADLHRLFDTGQLAINPETLIPVFSASCRADYAEYTSRAITLPKKGPNPSDLKTRWKHFQKLNNAHTL